jgi:DNA-binding transcriptional ArsR family regulator
MADRSAVLNRVFYALADPTRRGIVERLGERPSSVSVLAAPLDMSLAAVLQHVQVLEECGLISTAKVGRTRTCTLDPQVLHSATDWLAERQRSWENQLDALGRYLAHAPQPTPEETA